MSQLSGYWTTGGATGHQQNSYTQSQTAIAGALYAACSAYQGVARNYKNELSGTVVGANSVRINTGGAIVDGQWYYNDATVDVTIPNAVGAGNKRIDRVVLRCSWTGFKAEIYRIPGSDFASPVAPAIVQTPGTTYDILLYQALVDTGGNVSITDERMMAVGAFALADNQVTTPKINNGAVTVEKLGPMKTTVYLQVVPNNDLLTTGTGKMLWTVPESLNNAVLIDADAAVYAVSSAGAPTIQLTVNGVAMLSTPITIDAGEYSSYTAATLPVIKAETKTMTTGKVIGVDINAAGTDTGGLDIIMVFLL